MPVPVWAMARTSRPAITSGMACAWIGVGVVCSRSASARCRVSARPSSENSCLVTLILDCPARSILSGRLVSGAYASRGSGRNEWSCLFPGLKRRDLVASRARKMIYRGYMCSRAGNVNARYRLRQLHRAGTGPEHGTRPSGRRLGRGGRIEEQFRKAFGQRVTMTPARTDFSCPAWPPPAWLGAFVTAITPRPNAFQFRSPIREGHLKPLPPS